MAARTTGGIHRPKPGICKVARRALACSASPSDLAVEGGRLNELVSISAAELDGVLAAVGDELRVLYLWGPDCPNCVIFKRRLPALLEALADVEFQLFALDVYAHPEIAKRFAVHGIPHFILFKSGKKLGKMSEFRGDRFWADVIREHA